MAGIGFELRRMIDQREGFVAKVRAYACAGLISSGPWLMTILTLTLLNLAGPYLGGGEGYALFRALVTYAFAFSLVLQGFLQMAVTRRVADLLYAQEYDRVLPAFAASLAAVGLVHALIGTVFCYAAGFPPVLSFLAVTLFSIIGMTWIALIWLSVVRQYDDVLRAYVYGTLVAMVGVLLIFFGQGTVGVLAAYTAGQAFTLVLLLRTILRGMETGGGREPGIFTSLIRFPGLVAVGFLYNAAIWVDKIVFWFSDGLPHHPLVRSHPLYDTCSFLAYLTVVPALALNLVRLETSFYEEYRAYYGAILAGTPLGLIEDKRQRMFQSLRENIVSLLRIQGFLSASAILFAPVIIDFLELPPVAVRVFRLTCTGAFFHVLLLINVLMQMYFDLRRQALATSLLFCLLNGGLAWWSASRGVETYGIGYAVASLISLVLGFQLLHGSLERLDYHTFTSQPIGSKEERRAAEALAAEEREREEAEETGEEEEAEAAPAEGRAREAALRAGPAPLAAGEMGTLEGGPDQTPAAPAPAATAPAREAAGEAEPEPAPERPVEAALTATDVGAPPAARDRPAVDRTATDVPVEAPEIEEAAEETRTALEAAVDALEATATDAVASALDEAATGITATDVEAGRTAPPPPRADDTDPGRDPAPLDLEDISIEAAADRTETDVGLPPEIGELDPEEARAETQSELFVSRERPARPARGEDDDETKAE